MKELEFKLRAQVNEPIHILKSHILGQKFLLHSSSPSLMLVMQRGGKQRNVVKSSLFSQTACAQFLGRRVTWAIT